MKVKYFVKNQIFTNTVQLDDKFFLLNQVPSCKKSVEHSFFGTYPSLNIALADSFFFLLFFLSEAYIPFTVFVCSVCFASFKIKCKKVPMFTMLHVSSHNALGKKVASDI